MTNIKFSIYKHSKINKNKKSQVYLSLRNRDTNNRKLINLFQISIKEWDKRTRKANHNCYMKIQYNNLITEALNFFEERIYVAEKNAEYYTEETLYCDYINRNKSKKIDDAFDQRIIELKEQGSLGNMGVYKDSKNFFNLVLKEDMDLKNLKSINMVELINKNFINARNDSNCNAPKKPISNATILLRLRTLRALYNWVSKNNKNWKLADVPFDEWMSEFPNRAVKKIPLTQDEIANLLENANCNDVDEELYLDLFRLSYYLMGINFIDILHLQHDNLIRIGDNVVLRYNRTKTSNTRRGSEIITIPIQQPAIELIQKINGGIQHSSKLINVGDPLRIDGQYFHNLGKKMRKRINNFIAREAEQLGIQKKVNLHILRVTSGTALFDNGVKPQVISQLYNHSSPEITKKYYINSNNLDFDSNATTALYQTNTKRP